MDLLSYDEKGFRINAQTAVYFFTTFGFPPEILTEVINEELKKDKTLAHRHKLIAYNKWTNS